MEVESTDFDPLVKGILIGGKPYKGYMVEKGNYLIDKKDGLYGSVTLKARLVQ